MLHHRIWRSVVEVLARTTAPSDATGIAVLLVMVALALMAALLGSLGLVGNVETHISSVARDGAGALHAADAVVHRALVDLRTADWSTVLGGAVSTFTDGAPSGTRILANGSSLDLDRETADLSCGQPAGCTEADTIVVAGDRPWGPRNPRWRLYAYGPLANLLPGDPLPPTTYVAAWIADDPTDADGNPLVDSVDDTDPGHAVLMVVGRSYGPGSASRTVQIAVQRVGANLRILAWHERIP